MKSSCYTAGMVTRVDESLSAQLASWGVDGKATYLGNTVNEYIVAFLIFAGAFLVVHLLQWILVRWLSAVARRTKTDLDDILVSLFAHFRPPFYAFVALWLATRTLDIVGVADIILTSVLTVWVVYQAVTVGGVLVEELMFKRIAHDRDPTLRSALRLVVGVAKGVLWSFGIILLLSNLGVEVTSLIAGVSIAGIAVAFALQNILADLLSAFVLYFDRPFSVGDSVTVGTNSGTIAYIGLRSTRIRATTGEEVSIPNQDIAKARIQNFKRMKERRVVYTFNLHVETPYEKLAQVPDLLRTIVSETEHVRLDRAHFSGITGAAFVFEVAYFVTSAEHMVYMNAQEQINLEIVKRLEAEGVKFV